MKPRIIFSITIAALLTGCGERKQADELEQLKKQNAELAEGMAAKEKALAEEKIRAAQAEADRVADANRVEADRLAAERASIDAERKRIEQDAARATAQKREEMERELRRREEAQELAEKKAAATARANVQAEEARIAGERAANNERPRISQPLGAGRNSDFFYTALDPYGDWEDVEGYGPVFLPREAQQGRNWRPYTDGEWVRSEQGWTWRSNEPHGWATCHYGRWVRHLREGWMWVPGSEWAPAWVSWRKSETHIGWAPLPPEAHSGRGFNASVDEYYDIGARNYNFVLRERFGAGRTYVGRIVEPERNVTIIQNTVNVTNITYRGSGNNAVIVNEGPDMDFVNARSTTPVQIVRLQRDDVPEGRGTIAPAVITAGLMRMVAPVMNHDRPVARPLKVRKTATREFDRGWNGTDDTAVKAIRQKLAAEARKAEEDERDAYRKLPAEKKPVVAKPGTVAVPTPAVKPVVQPVEKPAPQKTVVPEKVAPRIPQPPAVKKEAAPAIENNPQPAPPVQPAPVKVVPKAEVKTTTEPAQEPAPKATPQKAQPRISEPQKIDAPAKPADAKTLPAPNPKMQKREVLIGKPPTQPQPEPVIPKPVNDLQKPKTEAAAIAKPASETPADAEKKALKRLVKPLINKPDPSPETRVPQPPKPDPASSAQEPAGSKTNP